MLRFTRNREDAYDLTQEAFIKAYSARHTFRGSSSLYTWIYKIAINLAINFKVRDKASKFASIDESTELAASGKTSDDLMRAELRANIDEAISKLPARQKMVFLLHYHDEKPHAEIAALLGITEGAVKANYHQAVKKLRLYLGRYMREGEK